MQASEGLLQAIAVTAELTATQLSEAAARVMASDLARYPEAEVIDALTRCRRELKGRLTIADVISRLEDGRPGPEEAWSLIPQDEYTSVVWTEEMRSAFGVAGPLIHAGDKVAARMAFLEHYRKAVRDAREAGKPAKWSASLGHDVMGQEVVLLEAAMRGRISREYVAGLLPHRMNPAPNVAALLPDMSGERRSLKAALEKAREKKSA